MHRQTNMKILMWAIALAILSFFAGGCTSPHGGPAIYYPVASGVNAVLPKRRLPVEGSDGTSIETAFRVRSVPESRVELEETHMVYDRFWHTQTPPLTLEELPGISRRTTMTVGQRRYDVVTLTMRDGKAHTIYFDVTDNKGH